jgi:hypothetical protein
MAVYTCIYWLVLYILPLQIVIFNNISVISWRSVFIGGGNRGPGESHRPVASNWQLYHIMLYTSPWSRFELTTSVVIGTDCKSSVWQCKWLYIHVYIDWFYIYYRCKLFHDNIFCHFSYKHLSLLECFWTHTPHTRCRIKSIPFGKYRRYSITFGYYNDSFWKVWHIWNDVWPKKMEKDQEHK